MQFVSKNSNLRVVLRSGIPANPLSGDPARPGLYVKFINGLAEVKDQDIIDRMMRHPAFEQDFIAVNDAAKEDPYAYNRSEVEPAHVIQEMKYGHIEKTLGTPKQYKMSPELKKFIDETSTTKAMEIVKQLLPKMIAEFKQTEAPKEETSENVESKEVSAEEDKPVKPSKKDKSKKEAPVEEVVAEESDTEAKAE